MSNPNALLLLSDHIKLSLLERQRAKTLNLSRDSQDGHISRSLEQFREGLETQEKERARLQEAGDETKATALGDTLTSLQKQYHDLTSQFHGFASPAIASTLTLAQRPIPRLRLRARAILHGSRNRLQTAAPDPQGLLRPQNRPLLRSRSPTPPAPDDDLHHLPHPGGGGGNPLFPYRDDPDDGTAGYRDRAEAEGLSNVQVHAYHQRILEEQDAQLDALGASISRQRELSMRIGDELDEHVIMLDESERVVDRHQGTLDRARRQVARVARSASESKQMVAIVILIVVLVLLIAVLK